MGRVVFVDLDDTLFQTARKDPTATRLAAVDGQGAPLSFQSDRQASLLDWLSDGARVIPVTGRNVQAFRRVTLAFGDRAICSFGGVVLNPDGTPDPEWHGRMAAAAPAAAPALDTLHAVTRQRAEALGIDVRHRVIHDADLPLYLSVKHNAGSGAETARLAEAMAPHMPAGWAIHRNGSNMALLPPFLGKAHAVRFVMDALRDPNDPEPLLTIGVGDSLTDLGYMALCDYALTPRGTQIADLFARWTQPAAAHDPQEGSEDAA